MKSKQSAPAPFPRLLLALAVASLACALGATLASAEPKGVVGVFGGAGSQGGKFGGQVGGVAVNQASGDLYVVDASNQRVQQFDADGTFIRAWGWGVATGAEAFEICTVAADCQPGRSGGGAGQLGLAPGSRIGVGPDGAVYVADSSNHRVQKFTAAGAFVMAFGFDVVADGPEDSSNQEEQKLTVEASGGTFTLRFPFGGEATGPIAFDASAATLEAELNSLGSIGGVGGSVSVSGGPGAYTVLFGGSLSGDDVDPIGVDPAGLEQGGFSGFGKATVTTIVDGGGFEVCTSVCKSGSRGTQDGQLAGPSALAVDPGNGDVLVGDSPISGFRVQRLSEDGVFKSKFGGSFGNDPGEFFGVGEIAVDSTGATYVLERYEGQCGECRVQKFDASGQLIGTFAQAQLSSKPSALAVDPLSDHVYVTQSGSEGAQDTLEFDATGSQVETHGGVLGTLAVGGSTGRIYVGGGPTGDRVFIIDAQAQPNAILDPPTDVGSSSATFSATINPEGVPTAYRFQYSKDGIDWTSVKSVEDIGEGTADVPVDDQATGLEPNAQYRVRLVVTTEIDGFPADVFLAGPLTFTTEPSPPTVTTVTTGQRTTTSARLFGRVNPNNLPTTYYFEYGETEAYGSKVPIPNGDAGDGFGDQVVSTEISGLNPDTTYHYRLVATNGEEQGPGDALVEGADATFTTRGAGAEPPERSAEMVTPPFKIVRAAINMGDPVGENPNPGVPSADGEVVAWSSDVFPMTDEAATGADGDTRIIRRTPTGWVWQTRNTLSSKLKIDCALSESVPTSLSKQDAIASSADFETLAWYVENGELIESEGCDPDLFSESHNPSYTRRDGTGTEGFTPWVTNALTQIRKQGFSDEGANPGAALINDSGTGMVLWGSFIGLAEDPSQPGDEDPTDNPVVGGPSIYLQHAADPDDMPSAPKDLVNECTGGAADPTPIPARTGTGPNATLTTQSCLVGSLTSRGGAVVGNRSGGAATAMSNDARRVFFTSPYKGCPGTGFCPPRKLYVRQYDANGGSPVVRWISRAQGVGPQRVAELAGADFQGASRSVRHVYFTTASPLLPTDPNGGESITTGEASSESSDLYRYTLPEALATDPGSGTLTRITGGPTGLADPNASSGSADSFPENDQASLRFLSDDGERAYFLTVSPIDGADATPPKGGATLPGDSASQPVRNLYLFDGHESGPDRYRFIASLPYPSGSPDCAAKSKSNIADGHVISGLQTRNNCFRGTADGSHVIFFSFARLTPDDGDNAGDVYLYDSSSDELIRVSAGHAGALPYTGAGGETTASLRNADLGTNSVAGGFYGFFGPAGSLDKAGGWGGRGRNYNLAKDGNGVVSVFFQSKSELVPQDQNGDHMDVYEWREGELSLISPASPGHYSFYSGNSVDGQDVFIATTERIDPREIDDFDYDIYDMRVGGGFPYTPPPTPCDVLALKCEGGATPPPAGVRAPTVGFAGPGNLKKPGKCRKGQARKKGRCVKAKARAKAKKTSHKAGSKRKGGSK